MKSLIKWLFVLAVLVSIAAYALYRFMPETEAAKYVTPYVEFAIARGKIAYDFACAKLKEGDERRAAKIESTAAAEAPSTPASESAVKEEKPKPVFEKIASNAIVFVYEFDLANEESVDLLPRIEQIWQSFKHHQFKLVGSHRGEKSKKLKRLLKKARVTFPVYEGPIFESEPRAARYPFMFVRFGEKVVYRGYSDREATEALVNAISEAAVK